MSETTNSDGTVEDDGSQDLRQVSRDAEAAEQARRQAVHDDRETQLQIHREQRAEKEKREFDRNHPSSSDE